MDSENQSADQSINVEDGLVETNKDLSRSPLANEDIMPTSIERRFWGIWDISALWISMCITIALYYVISGMVAQGLNLTQVLTAVFLGTFLIFIPLVLNGHAGTKYGIPFPVMVRSSFGINGAHIPAVFRGLVACGWFGVQCWIGGLAIHVAMQNVEKLTGWDWIWPSADAPWMVLNLVFAPGAGEFLGFLIFWGVCVWIVWNGIESIRWLEVLGAPFLIVCFLALFVWAWVQGGGFMHVLTEGMQEIGASEGLSGKEFWFVFVPALMGVIGYWATLSLNIPDFTRYSESQSSQATGQFIGLNFTMGPFAFVIAFITAGAFLIYMPKFAHQNIEDVVLKSAELQQALEIDGSLEGTALEEAVSKKLEGKNHEELLNIAESAGVGEPVQEAIEKARDRARGLWDPMTLLSTFEIPWIVILVMVAFAIATLTTNMAANVVAPANSFSNLLPQTISFRAGGVITGIIGLLTFPWVLLSNPGFYIDLWLGGAASLLAPIGGIMIGDYFLYRKTKLQLNKLYKRGSRYHFENGYNSAGIITFIVSILLLLPGWLLRFFVELEWTGMVESADPFALWGQGSYMLSLASWVYLINWIFGFTFSLLCYWALAKFFYGEAEEPDPEDLVSSPASA